MRRQAQVRNPYSRWRLWIPGRICDAPRNKGAWIRVDSGHGRVGLCCMRDPRQQPFLDGLDLQRQISRVDPALRQAAGDEPEARLRGARVHVAQLLTLAESPDRADAVGDPLAEQLAHQML